MDSVAASPTGLATTAPPVPARRSAFVAVALGWLFPGLGQLYMGRPLKALLMCAAIGGLFYAGLRMTGFTCVDPQTYSLEFIAHAFLGGPTAATYYLTQGLELQEAMPHFEVGRLYAAVAGLLNVVAVCDALGDVLEHNRAARVFETLRARFLAERQWMAERVLGASPAPAPDPSQGLLPLDREDEDLASRPEEPARPHGTDGVTS